jgi:hypothetical protein
VVEQGGFRQAIVENGFSHLKRNTFLGQVFFLVFWGVFCLSKGAKNSLLSAFFEAIHVSFC